MFPALYIGFQEKIADMEKANISVYRVSNKDDFDTLYHQLVGMPNGSSPIVIYDISVLKYSMDKILKFIEEITFDLVCISSEDCFTGALLSRFKTVVKEGRLYNNVDNKFSGIELDIDGGDFIERLIVRCPSALQINYYLTRSGLPSKDKLWGYLISEPK